MDRPDTAKIIGTAFECGIVVPGFNIPYLPMMEPVVRALRDCNSFGLIMVASLEFMKFEAKSLKAIRDEYEKVKDERHTRLHLDHVPVVDEDGRRSDFEKIIGEALELGYESVMIDGSRLSLNENIDSTAQAVGLAAGKVPVEAELGAVLGHEAGPLPPYEELFASRKGFTSPEDTFRFVRESSCSWLSVAVGNIHGAISAAGRQKEKPHARIDLTHLKLLRDAAHIPLVLHGGTGIPKEYVKKAVSTGIAKMNVATAIRQPYERNLSKGVKAAQNAVYETVTGLLKSEFSIENSCDILTK
ncbi:MAG: Fructose-bisphosphate aldolase [Lentisphaerae bacterium ADurb.Bin242]|nr:MAG: Fructose-bisphosphate aldolase [Lentisphaerae bacterium ADurb.Bin242]